MSEQNVGNVRNVVVDRLKLLDILKENKARHDELFQISLSGYWMACKERINKKCDEFGTYLTELTSDFQNSTNRLLDKIEKKERIDNYTRIDIPTAYFDYQLNLKYPECHTEEYERAIRSVELNVYNNIELTENEFNQYVMNNWSWRQSFIATNNLYAYSGATYVTGSYIYDAVMASGCSIL